MSERSSRFWQVMLMLPFFIIGVAFPVFFYGFSGDGPPNLKGVPYSPVTPVVTAPTTTTSYADYRRLTPPPTDPDSRSTLVETFRGFYDGFVDRFVSASFSPAAIKLVVFAFFFVTSVVLVRLLLVWAAARLGGFLMFLAHKAAAPMFMGFLAVGSTWGIHQTIAQQFGMTWAAATVTLTAAIASLFSLAGVKLQ